MNFESDNIKEYDEIVNALHGKGSYNYALKRLCLDLRNKSIPSSKPSIKEPSVLELKALPFHFQYAFLGGLKEPIGGL